MPDTALLLLSYVLAGFCPLGGRRPVAVLNLQVVQALPDRVQLATRLTLDVSDRASPVVGGPDLGCVRLVKPGPRPSTLSTDCEDDAGDAEYQNYQERPDLEIVHRRLALSNFCLLNDNSRIEQFRSIYRLRSMVLGAVAIHILIPLPVSSVGVVAASVLHLAPTPVLVFTEEVAARAQRLGQLGLLEPLHAATYGYPD